MLQNARLNDTICKQSQLPYPNSYKGGTIMITLAIILNIFLILVATAVFAACFLNGVGWLCAAMGLLLVGLGYTLTNLIDQ